MLNKRVGMLIPFGLSYLRLQNKGSRTRPKLDIRPRHSVLQALEGWYSTRVEIPEKYRAIVSEYEEFLNSQKEQQKKGSEIKLTRWLLRNNKLSIREASDLGKFLDQGVVKFKLSCRHHDLVRLAETSHYASCMSHTWGAGQQQLQYLADPDVAVVYVADAAGKFSWRSLVRLVMEDGDHKWPNQGYGLVFYRVYGNGPTQAIFDSLDKCIRVYQGLDIRHNQELQDQAQIMVSPTIHNNRFLSKPIWTDMKGISWDANRRIKIKVLPRGIKVEHAKQNVRYPHQRAVTAHAAYVGELAIREIHERHAMTVHERVTTQVSTRRFPYPPR